MKLMNKKDAIKFALAACPPPENIQGFWYRVRNPDGSYSERMSFTEAKQYRTICLIDHARKLLGFVKRLYQGGRWIDYV
jgi:hypothetical protein